MIKMFQKTHKSLIIWFATLSLFNAVLELAANEQGQKDFIALLGSNVKLVCKQPNGGHWDVKWYRGITELNGERYDYNANGDLIINDVQLSDMGEYICSVNELTSNDFTVMLRVRTPIKVIIQKKNIRPVARYSVKIPCLIFDYSGFIEPKVRWFKDGDEIDFENNSRFSVRNNTLMISNLQFSDSGKYICTAETEIDGDEDADELCLFVDDVPAAPLITDLVCEDFAATISWEQVKENVSEIRYYIIEYASKSWDGIWGSSVTLNTTKRQKKISLKPWAEYRFHVIAYNEVGASRTSQSSSCTTAKAAPSMNPTHIATANASPNTLTIVWQPMAPIDHHGPRLKYCVFWKRNFPLEKWNYAFIPHWQERKFSIKNQPNFVEYRIKVESSNDFGDSVEFAQEFIGYSSEGWPTESPTGLTLVNIINFTTAVIQWNPVPIDSVNGRLLGYFIQMWNEADGHQLKSYNVTVDADTTEISLPKLHRSLKNFVRIFAFNSRYLGPPTQILWIKTLAPDPDCVQSFDIFPLGSTGFLLRWTQPLQPNGIITGYNIYYEKINETEKFQRTPQILDPQINHAKLDGLNPDTLYRVHIAAVVNKSDGRSIFVEASTNGNKTLQPDVPSFSWDLLAKENGFVKLRLNWLPNVDGIPGSKFFVKFREKCKEKWNATNEIVTDDFIMFTLPQNYVYEFIVISVDGNYKAESDVKELSTLERPITDQKLGLIITAMISMLLLVAVVTSVFLKISGRNKSILKRKKPNEIINPGNLYHLNSFRADRHSFPEFRQMFESEAFQRSSMDEHQLNGFLINYEEHLRRLRNISLEQSIPDAYSLSNLMDGSRNTLNKNLSLDEQADMLPYDQNYEFPREDLLLGIQLGTGAFGVVFQATAKMILPDEDETQVAVKMIKNMADNEVLRALVLELKILVHLGKHLNIVNLLGAVTKNIQQRELMIIFEYCKFGNLQSFLVKNRQHFIDQIIAEEDVIDSSIRQKQATPNNGYLLHTNAIATPPPELDRTITTTDLVSWSFQIARGMHYLAMRRVLHGDLAARNILLCEGNVVKICDFGLARSMYKTGNYLMRTERPLPYKWLALESIGDHIFSTYSDVWSFGIVLWELFSLGAVPYPGMIAGAQLYVKIKNGYRMDKPDFCTEQIYNIMLSCWHSDPESRPLFDKLEKKFSNILDPDVSEHYIAKNEPYSKANSSFFNVDQTDFLALFSSPLSQNLFRPTEVDQINMLANERMNLDFGTQRECPDISMMEKSFKNQNNQYFAPMEFSKILKQPSENECSET